MRKTYFRKYILILQLEIKIQIVCYPDITPKLITCVQMRIKYKLNIRQICACKVIAQKWTHIALGDKLCTLLLTDMRDSIEGSRFEHRIRRAVKSRPGDCHDRERCVRTIIIDGQPLGCVLILTTTIVGLLLTHL